MTTNGSLDEMLSTTVEGSTPPSFSRRNARVPDDDATFSSGGDMSSPETAPEQADANKSEKENKKHKKVKKTRHQSRSQSKSSDTQTKNTYSSLVLAPQMSLNTPRIEKSSSFKRKEKPSSLEMKYNGEKRLNSTSRATPDRTMECNIVLLGDLGVGKTALAVRFVTRRYLHEYDPSLERTYEKTLQCSGEYIQVKLWDTVSKTWDSFNENADAYLVMYSMTSSNSATNAQNIVHSIRSSQHAKHKPILLCANKSELQHARKVPREDVEQFAENNGCSFKEFSVACTMNVDPIIKFVIKAVLAQEGGRITPSNLKDTVDSKAGLARKPSNARHKMKKFLSKKT